MLNGVRSGFRSAPRHFSLDPSLEDLEAQLQLAVSREEYKAAAELRDKIEEARSDSSVSVEEANRKFYKAFMDSDLTAMSAIWGTGDHVQCIHPSSACIVGREDVLESWKLVLGGVKKGMVKITLDDKRTHVSDTLAYITCIENIDSGDTRGRMVATNIFEKQDGRWKMVVHHASPSPL